MPHDDSPTASAAKAATFATHPNGLMCRVPPIAAHNWYAKRHRASGPAKTLGFQKWQRAMFRRMFLAGFLFRLPMAMTDFIAELKRRYIYRVFAGYAVAAWLLLQLFNN